MSEPKKRRLDYNNDIILSNQKHFIALINPYQQRSHLIIRNKPGITPDYSNDLSTFTRELKDEFWYIVQEMAHRLQCPCLLCHHFGNFRSADHFHVHIVVNSANFAKFAVSKMEKPENPKIIQDQIERKCQYLIKRSLEYKKGEIEEIMKYKESHPTNESTCEEEWGDWIIEIHNYLPRINFIPKQPILYYKEPEKVIPQLQQLRESVFDAMTSFAKKHNFTAYRTWQKLSGDVFYWNNGRDPSRLIFGVLQPYPPELYAIHPDRDEWFQRWQTCEQQPGNNLHISFDPLSCV